MKILVITLGWTVFLAGLFLVFYPAVYWFFKPQFTQMEIFKQFFGLTVVGLVFAVGGYLLIFISREEK